MFERGSGEDVVLTDPGTLRPFRPLRQHAVISTGHHTLYLGGGLLLQFRAPAVNHTRHVPIEARDSLMGDAHPTGRLLWDTHSLFHMPGVTGLWVTVLGLTQMGTHLTSLCRLSDCCTRSVSLSSFLVVSAPSSVHFTVSDFTLRPLTPDGHCTVRLTLGGTGS